LYFPVSVSLCFLTTVFSSVSHAFQYTITASTYKSLAVCSLYQWYKIPFERQCKYIFYRMIWWLQKLRTCMYSPCSPCSSCFATVAFALLPLPSSLSSSSSFLFFFVRACCYCRRRRWASQAQQEEKSWRFL
jgi:hypothetical protein